MGGCALELDVRFAACLLIIGAAFQGFPFPCQLWMYNFSLFSASDLGKTASIVPFELYLA